MTRHFVGLELSTVGDFSCSGPYNKANSSFKEHSVLCVISTSMAHLVLSDLWVACTQRGNESSNAALHLEMGIPTEM